MAPHTYILLMAGTALKKGSQLQIESATYSVTQRPEFKGQLAMEAIIVPHRRSQRRLPLITRSTRSSGASGRGQMLERRQRSVHRPRSATANEEVQAQKEAEAASSRIVELRWQNASGLRTPKSPAAR